MRKAFYFLRLPVRLALSVIFIMSVASAGARDVEQARQAALQQMKAHAAKKANGRGGTAMAVDPQLVFSKAKSGDEAYYYVFTAGENLGYTVVSGDDRLPAIVGYTESGGFDAQRMPDGLAAFMQQYQNFVDNATDEQIACAVAFKAQAKHATVAPFMPEKWNQLEPYNNKCPEYATGKTAVTGCVATAVAQILHYWSCTKNSPVSLQNDIPEYTTDSYRIPMSAVNADEGMYDWANMPDVYGGSETDAQNNAVAKLMLHVGCAVKMDYADTSGANADAETFTKYFGMDKELVHELRRFDYDISQWDKILYDEIAAERPVYYTGSTSKREGHAFVIHGYDDGLYYVNWGWGGYCDGYFDITLLNPNSSDGAGASTAPDGYSVDNYMIVGIQPDNNVVDKEKYGQLTSNGFTKEYGCLTDLAFSDGKVTAHAYFTMYNFNQFELTKYVSLGYVDESGNVVNVATPKQIEFPAANEYGYANAKSCDVAVSFAAQEGKVYGLRVIESSDNSTWAVSGVYRAQLEGIVVPVRVSGGEVSVIDYQSALAATISLDSESGGYAGMTNMINVTVTNTGNREYYDKVQVTVIAPGQMYEKDVYEVGITAPVGGSTTFSFPYTPKTAGEYKFIVRDNVIVEMGTQTLTFEESTPPVLAFVSIKCTNASENKVYADYNAYDWDEEVVKQYEVEMYEVKDTKAEFEFVVGNYGGYYSGPVNVFEYNKAEGKILRTRIETLNFKEYGETTFKFTLEGKAGDVVGIVLSSGNADAEITPLSTDDENKHFSKNPVKDFSLDCGEIVYLAGSNPDGITSAVADGADDNGAIYNLRGEKVTAPGKGIYIRNGKKFVIK